MVCCEQRAKEPESDTKIATELWAAGDGKAQKQCVAWRQHVAGCYENRETRVWACRMVVGGVHSQVKGGTWNWCCVHRGFQSNATRQRKERHFSMLEETSGCKEARSRIAQCGSSAGGCQQQQASGVKVARKLRRLPVARFAQLELPGDGRNIQEFGVFGNHLRHFEGSQRKERHVHSTRRARQSFAARHAKVPDVRGVCG